MSPKKVVGQKALGINDAKFAVDSMLNGVGRYLRRCGFDSRTFGSNRFELIEFCQNNEEFFALSTGKGYKQIASMIPERSLNLPVCTAFAQPMSDLVKFVMTKLNIVIRPEDMFSRCEDCNTVTLINVPRRLVEVLFHLYLMRHDVSWMGIEDEEHDVA